MSTTTKTKKQATTTARTTKKAAKQAERTVKTVVLDSAYATVGFGDSVVAAVRELPGKAPQIRGLGDQAEKAVTQLRAEAPKKVSQLRSEATQQLDTFAARGRKVVKALRGSSSTRKALEQTKIARTQVKAAATSVRKAVAANVDAAENAAETTGTKAR